MMLQRLVAIEAIHRGLANNPGVALLGPRQCGKTTLARQVAQERSQLLATQIPAAQKSGSQMRVYRGRRRSTTTENCVAHAGVGCWHLYAQGRLGVLIHHGSSEALSHSERWLNSLIYASDTKLRAIDLNSP